MLRNPRTIPDLIEDRAAKTPELIGWYEKRSNGVEAISWAAYREQVRAAATGLRRLGVARGDRVAIVAPPCLQWDILDKASMSIGAVTVGIDPRAADDDQRMILEETRARWMGILPNAASAQLANTMTENGGRVVALAPTDASWRIPAISWSELTGQGIDLERDLPDASDLATIVYTSGTTGRPKPIPYLHGQLLVAVAAILDTFGPIDEQDSGICWLPLASLFQRMMNLCAIASGAATWMVADPADLIATMSIARPTIFVGVPRFYEKLRAEIVRRSEQLAPWRRALFLAAHRNCATRAAYANAGLVPPAGLSLVNRASVLVLALARRQFGGDRLRLMITGSAPTSRELHDFFDGFGLPLFEAYGVSENAVPIAANRLMIRRAGSVGKPLAQQDVEIAADGEILVKGPGVVRRDYGAPSRVDGDGFLATGDLGYFDRDGYLYVTGRKDQIFKTSTGRRIAPEVVEQALYHSSCVDWAIVLGNGRKVPIALLTLNSAEVEQGDDGADTVPACVLARLSQDLRLSMASLAPFERVQGCLILRRPFTVAAGHLTASLKPRRKAIETLFAKEIDALYTRIDGLGRQSRNSDETAAPILMVAG